MANKRKDIGDEDSENGMGTGEVAEEVAGNAEHKVKRAKAGNDNEDLYLENLPCADAYERSLMHRDVVNFVCVIPANDFIVTTSVDGHVKFWKKTANGIEFVKHFKGHMGPIVATAVSHDGNLLATTSIDKWIKVFDVINFDMINQGRIDFLPKSLCFIYKTGQAQSLLACSDLESSTIHIVDASGSPGVSLYTVSIHAQPVGIMRYHPYADVVVSIDDGGMVEYWHPNQEKGFPQPEPPVIDWTFKSDTDLYTFKKAKVAPTALNFSPDFKMFVTFSFGDRQFRVFDFYTGRLKHVFDESLDTASEAQQTGTAVVQLDDMDFGRRLAIDREIEKQPGGQSATVNAVFDESGKFLIYPTLLGMKVIRLETGEVVRLIGKNETQRFMNIELYQGAPQRKSLVTMEMAASDNPVLKESETTDPTIFATAYKRKRFFLFTRRDPDSVGDGTGQGRDIFNEKPSREEQMAAMQTNLKQTLGSAAILHTTMGDIHIRLFPEYAPKAVENFVGLVKKGYYDHVKFHRVIKGFMIQTGDPLGDGTGGESLWGHDFEDEFNKAIKHDRSFTVSMANAGPNTNASQFFITVAPTPWLDNKHTIFGRATGGMDVINRIENVKTDKMDRPYEEVKILSIEVR